MAPAMPPAPPAPAVFANPLNQRLVDDRAEEHEALLREQYPAAAQAAAADAPDADVKVRVKVNPVNVNVFRPKALAPADDGDEAERGCVSGVPLVAEEEALLLLEADRRAHARAAACVVFPYAMALGMVFAALLLLLGPVLGPTPAGAALARAGLGVQHHFSHGCGFSHLWRGAGAAAPTEQEQEMAGRAAILHAAAVSELAALEAEVDAKLAGGVPVPPAEKAALRSRLEAVKRIKAAEDRLVAFVDAQRRAAVGDGAVKEAAAKAAAAVEELAQ